MINGVLNPKSIAVIGVSTNPVKLGSVIYNNIIVSGYRGSVFPVNPKHDEIFGRKCYTSISKIPDEVDQAIFVIPALNILEELELAGKTKKIKSAVIISAGFKEIGEEGVLRENKLFEIAQKYNIRLLGPNCLGYINPKYSLNASFAASNPSEGDIYFLSQSGAICSALLDMAVNNNLGFDKFVSYGNKTDINEIDLIKDALNSETVKVVGVYVEEITDGGELVNLIKTNRKKPVVILNPGKTEQAQTAISSHTGSLTGSAKIREQALKQSGAILVNRMNEMYNLLMGFSWSKPILGNRVAVVTNAGGPGILATDHLIEKGLILAKFSNKTSIELKSKLPPNASVNNPVDLIGDALAERYEGAIQAISKDPNVDSILVILTPQFVTQIEETAKLIINESKSSEKPIFVAFIGGKYANAGLERLYDNRIPAFVFVEDAIDVISKIVEFNNFDKLNVGYNVEVKSIERYRTKDVEWFIEAQLKQGEKILNEEGVQLLCKQFEIDTPSQILTNNIEEIHEFLKQNKKIVMKAMTSDLIHKTEFKGVYVDITNIEEVGFVFYKLQKHISEAKDQKLKKFHELLIQEQIIGGEELFIGINRDGSKDVYSKKQDRGFGHQILFGKGGIYAEVYKDISLRLLPLSMLGFEELINSTKVSKILHGIRTNNKLAVGKIIELFDKLQQMVISYPEIVSIDINPVIVNSKRAVVADMKVFVT
ncbi:acetate--CoA ligase family protein [Candidatus Dojkabacteria bacterium]|nr:acetate--CoA ligase family protein [Candidatus Dojkabacteria bacterium]